MINTIDCIRDLAIPRMTSSEGEKKAQLILFNYLKKVGISPKAEKFTYNRALYVNFKIGLIIALVYNVNNLIFSFFFIPIIQFIILIGLFLLEGFILYHILHGTSAFGKTQNFESKNITGEKFSQKHREFQVSMATIILIAHYDSIGHRFNSKLRNFLLITTVIGEFSIIVLSIFILILNLTLGQSIIVLPLLWTNRVLSGIISGELGLLLSHSFDNSSSGAIDNATGCSTIIKILDQLNELKTDLEWCDIRFLFSGAKKWGSWSTRSYLTTHREELTHYKDVYVITLDSLINPLQILRKRRLFSRIPSKSILIDLILHEARRIHRSFQSNLKKIQLGRNYFSFLGSSVEVVSIQSNDGIHHTQADRLEQVDIKIVEDVVEIIVNTIPLLDRWIGDKIHSAE